MSHSHARATISNGIAHLEISSQFTLLVGNEVGLEGLLGVGVGMGVCGMAAGMRVGLRSVSRRLKQHEW